MRKKLAKFCIICSVTKLIVSYLLNKHAATFTMTVIIRTPECALRRILPIRNEQIYCGGKYRHTKQ